jgi:hypothetical protein
MSGPAGCNNEGLGTAVAGIVEAGPRLAVPCGFGVVLTASGPPLVQAAAPSASAKAVDAALPALVGRLPAEACPRCIDRRRPTRRQGSSAVVLR